MTVITTSTSELATATPNQRKVDYCQNGVIWVASWQGAGYIRLNYSTDEGQTWSSNTAVVPSGRTITFAGTSNNHTPNFSMFIDIDDNMHVVFKDRHNGEITYVIGSPNQARTEWTWGVPLSLTTNTSVNYPDIVAFRDDINGGWHACVVASYISGSQSYVAFTRIPISEDTTYSTPKTDGLSTFSGSFGTLGGDYGTTTHGFPALDFNHTGDGKTASSTPHLYVAWSSGTTGTNRGIRFRKSTQLGGAWTWGSEREIMNGAYLYSASSSLSCLFDGTRVIVGGWWYTGSSHNVYIYERDEADTATTLKQATPANNANAQMQKGQLALDGENNVYIFGSTDEATKTFAYRRWRRDGPSMESLVVLDSNVNNTAYYSATRRAVNGSIHIIYTDGSSSPYEVTYFRMPALTRTVASSGSSKATAFSNQRKIDRTSNGNIWTARWNGSAYITFYCSADEGDAWNEQALLANDGRSVTFAGAGTTYTPNFSFFIDADDYMHVVYKDRHNGYIYYVRGTPNGSQTAWTWTVAYEALGHASFDYPDVVAHQEGSGWAVHLAAGYVTTGYAQMYAHRFDINSSGTVTSVPQGVVTNNYNSGRHLYPALDFHHTGDGKTVANGTPHVYLAWSAGTAGSGFGVRFKKAAYSGGSWTWGSEREIDGAIYASTTSRWVNCLYDGERVIIGGTCSTGSLDYVFLYERDEADTTTTELLKTASNVGYGGSLGYDFEKNLYLVTRPPSTVGQLRYQKWDRLSSQLESAVMVDYFARNDEPWPSVRRGGSDKLEFVNTNQSDSTYSVNYVQISLGFAPSHPLLIAPVDETVYSSDGDVQFDWEFQDPNQGDSQSKYRLVRRRVP